MKIIRDRIGDEPITINVLEHPDDLPKFRDFVAKNHRGLAYDTETSGLDIYSSTYKLRLAQFGNRNTAFVVPVENFGGPDVRRALEFLPRIIIQNAPFDTQVTERCLGLKAEELWPKIIDTKIYAHLVDPRGVEEGGAGTSLEQITGRHISAEVALRVKGSMSEIAKDLKTTKANVWKVVPLDHPGYNLYAGFDPILTTRAAEALMPLVPAVSRPLIAFEHLLAEICSYYERTGFLLDQEYTQGLSDRLREREEDMSKIARGYGIETVNSTDQVADALEELGIKIKGRTPSGKRKVDKVVLEELRKGTNYQAAVISEAVQEAKKARKWRTTWLDSFLAGMDSDGRCHASINALRARTARMSITGIPAQTLPGGDWTIRRCFVADDGHVTGSIDYKSQELRITAGLSGDRTMLDAFLRGDNLHLLTARAAFGEHVQKDDKEYKAGKGTNFAVVFGGGWKAVTEQFGVPMAEAKHAVATFWKTYPGVKRFAEKTMKEVLATGSVTTPSGRVIPVDAARSYAGMNYKIQETGRMVTARGLVKLHRAGFTPYVRLPIHDEVVVSLPEGKARWGADQIATLMAEQFGPVFLDTDVDIGRRSWGSLFGAEE